VAEPERPASASFHEILQGAEDDLASLEGRLAALRACGNEPLMTAATEARRLYRQRRRRDRYFPANLFAEPAWDILLDLYVAQAEGRATTTSSACIGAAVPQTTGLRWLTRLEDEGLVRRSTSAGDERMRLVTLTDDGFQRMTELLRKGG
jgi:hypothetical protein